MSNCPTVSACIICYNQRKFIYKAIEGALNQKVSYPYEVVIGDDCSTDGTLEICREYKRKYPGKIRLIERAQNHGINFNWRDTIQYCQGEFVGLCEGDDYWIDPLKIQKQVEFLKGKPEFYLCSHEIFIDYQDKKKSLKYFILILFSNVYHLKIDNFFYLLKIFIFQSSEFWKRKVGYARNKRFYDGSFTEMLPCVFSKKFIHTSSIVFRKFIFKEIPYEIWSYTLGHRLILLWSSVFGKFKHFKKGMAIRVMHNQSATNAKDEGKSLPNDKKQFLKTLKKYCNRRQAEEIDEYIKNNKI